MKSCSCCCGLRVRQSRSICCVCRCPSGPAFCASLLLEVQQLRPRTGRPHWLVFDEAHHLFPAGWAGASQAIPQALETALAITVSPQQLDGAFPRQVNS